MKKIFFIVLFIAASAAGYSQTVITSLEAKDHIGETVTVKGLVAFVFTTNKGKTLINFDEKYPNQSFTVVVSEESKIDISAIKAGSVFTVKGEIKSYKDKPEMQLESNDQIIKVE